MFDWKVDLCHFVGIRPLYESELRADRSLQDDKKQTENQEFNLQNSNIQHLNSKVRAYREIFKKLS